MDLLTTPAGRMAAGLALMASGGLILLSADGGPRRSDEPWPPPFEGEALERGSGCVQQRHSGEASSTGRPQRLPLRTGPGTARQAARGPLIPRQRHSRMESRRTLAHFPFE